MGLKTVFGPSSFRVPAAFARFLRAALAEIKGPHTFSRAPVVSRQGQGHPPLPTSCLIRRFSYKTLGEAIAERYKKMGGSQSVPDIDTEPEQLTVVKTPAEWKEILTPQQYDVCIKHGTERPNMGQLAKGKNYECVCCNQKLFSHSEKFESYSGWPAFYKPLEGAVRHLSDRSMGITRTEVRCKACGSHLGHVFNDGKPLRYCINAVCLKPSQE